MKTTQQIISDLDETDKESLLCGGSFDISLEIQKDEEKGLKVIGAIYRIAL